MSNNTLTINKLNLLFEDISIRSKMISDYGFGPSYNINSNRPLSYPFLWVEPVDSRVQRGINGNLTEYYKFNLYVMDKINKGDDNYIETSSDCDYILKTIVGEIDQSDYYVELDISIDGDVTLQPVYEETPDNSNGWMCELTLKLPMRYTPCNSPILPINGFTISLANNIVEYRLQGIQGPTGPQGPIGPQGIQGQIGYQGPQGFQGFNGSNGATGSQGPQGQIGSQGVQGAIGPQGVQGSQGNQGIQGPYGSTGAGGALGYYGSFYDTTTQTTATSSFALPMFINSTAESNGITNDAGTGMVFQFPGTYNIQFSAQLYRTNSGTDTIDIWFRKNGVDIPNTNSQVAMSGGPSSDPVIASWNYIVSLNANDKIQLMWSGTDNHIQIIATGTQSGPNRPASPSVIMTAQQVMYLQLGPTGSQGPQGNQGPIGFQGPQGFQGTIGSQGFQGSTGPTIITTGMVADGQGGVISTGQKGYYQINNGGTIQSWSIIGDQSGSISVDIWKRSGGVPTASGTIVGSGTPSLASSQYATGSVSLWTSATVSNGDILGYNIVSATTLTRAILELKITQ